MKKITIILAALLTASCASQHVVSSAPQVVRIKNIEQPVNITGTATVKEKKNLLTDELSVQVSIFFNGSMRITGFLDNSLSAELRGLPYMDHETSASCTSKPISQTDVECRCIVFIDNERTVTLTF